MSQDSTSKSESEEQGIVQDTILDGIRALIPEAVGIVFAYSLSDGSLKVSYDAPCGSCLIEALFNASRSHTDCRCAESIAIQMSNKNKLN